MRYLRFGIIALAVALLATIGGARVDDTAQAQTPSLAPQNVQAVDGANLGEVVVTWDLVAGAAYYRVGYVSETEFYAVTGAGRPWTEAYFFVDVKNTGQTEFTLKGLEPGVLHLFIVAGNASQYGEPEWDFTQIALLTPQSTAPGDYDTDNDGLIEISSLAQLDAVRYDTDGDGNVADQHYVLYTQAFTDPRFDMGCPSDGCHGYELAADLDFDTNGNGEDDAGDDYWNDGKGWEPIGDDSGRFNATFDGNSHTISNLYIDRPEEQSIGLFGRSSGRSVISSIRLSSVDVAGERAVGGLIGYNSGGKVANASVSGSVSGTGRFIGGLVGDYRYGGFVADSRSDATVSGNQEVGGLVGYAFGTSIVRSHATGDVTSVEYQAGGLVGDNSYGLVITSYANGNVSGGGNDVGGLLGINSRGAVMGSYAGGNVLGGGDNVGGLAGQNRWGNILGAYATGNVSGSGSGSDDIGGLVGDNRQGHIEESYATGSVSGTGGGADAIGGLVGDNQSGSRIERSYSIGSVTETTGSADAKVGGLVGEDSGDVNHSYWNTQTSGLSTSAGGEGKTTAELQSPTEDTGIYAEWGSAWDYGTSSQYPVLRHYRLSPNVQR